MKKTKRTIDHSSRCGVDRCRFLLSKKQLIILQGIMKTLPYLCIGLGCGLFGNGIGDFVSKKQSKKSQTS